MAAMLTPAQRLLQSFAACPRPWSPTCTTSLPSASNSGRARSAAAAAPPTMIVSVPASAPIVPPETGASSASMPRGASAAASSRARRGRRGRHVDAERAGRETLGRGRPGPSVAARTAAGDGSIVIATSAPSAASRALARALDSLDRGRGVEVEAAHLVPGRDEVRRSSDAPCGRARRMRRRSRLAQPVGTNGPALYSCPGSSRPSTPASHSATAISAARSTPVSTPRPSSR